MEVARLPTLKQSTLWVVYQEAANQGVAFHVHLQDSFGLLNNIASKTISLLNNIKRATSFPRSAVLLPPEL